MLGLNFYPHQDVYHTSFRALTLTHSLGPLHEDAYRIIDYFVLFPFDLGIIRHRGGEKNKIAASYADTRPYKWTATPASTFLQMAEYQSIAISLLRRRSYLANNGIELNEGFRPDAALNAQIGEYVESRNRVIIFLKKLLDEYGLFGEGGLKDRSTLMSFKYDVKRDAIIN